MATSTIRSYSSSGYQQLATGVEYAKAGSIVTVYIHDASPTTVLTSLGQLPAGLRPSVALRFSGHCDAYGRKVMVVRINTDGAVAIQSDASYQSGYAVCTYVI